MLTRVDVDAFQARIGSDVRLLARARDNGGVETAFFTYAGEDLEPLVIDGHPGCEFTVVAGRRVFRVTAVEGAVGGVYDLFEVLPDDTEVDLEEEIDLTFGPIHQVFIVGRVTARRAAGPRASAPGTPGGKAASKPAPKKPGPKKPGPKKSGPKKPRPKKAGPTKPARRKTAAKKIAAKKAAPKKTAPAKRAARPRRKSPRGRR